MKSLLLISAFALIVKSCCARAVSEDSVVSVYTNSSSGSDVYGQIATNIAEKITSPFYRLFGYNSSEHSTKRPFEHIELQENSTERDVEELSPDALQKTETKPEKVILFSSYLPPKERVNSERGYSSLPNGKLETLNETKNEIDDDFDDDFGFDDVNETPRGPFVYMLELIGSVIQLLWGGFLTIFKPAPTM